MLANYYSWDSAKITPAQITMDMPPSLDRQHWGGWEFIKPLSTVTIKVEQKITSPRDYDSYRKIPMKS